MPRDASPWWCVVPLAGLLAGGCVIPFAVPPIRSDVGTAHVQGERAPALHVAAGAHLASVVTELPFDLGAGYVGNFALDTLFSQGAYVEGEWRMWHGRHARVWAGSRAEVLFGDGAVGAGLTLRASAELYSVGQGEGQAEDSCGGASFSWLGVHAIGPYLEAGAQWLPDGTRALISTAGVTFRLPAALGVWIGIPGCER